MNDREWRMDPERLERLKDQARRAATEGIVGALEAVEQAIGNLGFPKSPKPPVPPTPPSSPPPTAAGQTRVQKMKDFHRASHRLNKLATSEEASSNNVRSLISNRNVKRSCA